MHEIERIRSAPCGVVVADLSTLSAKGRVVLARRLVREGACVIVAQSHHLADAM
jgi:hypothetical protein